MKCIIFLIAFLLTGCASMQPVAIVASCPKAIVPPLPRWPVQDLKPTTPPAQAIQALMATAIGQQDHIRILRAIINQQNECAK